MHWPSPETIAIILKIRDWVAPGAVALVCFFFIRYITKRDEFETDIEKKFEAHSATFSEKLNAHADKVSEASGKFSNAVLEVKSVAADMRKQNLEFQSKVNDKLAQVQEQTVAIQSTLERTSKKASEVEAKVDVTLAKVGEMAEKVQFHDRAVGEFAKRFMETEHRLDRAEQSIKRKPRKH